MPEINPNAPYTDDSGFTADELADQLLDSIRERFGAQVDTPETLLGDMLVEKAMAQINAREENK